MKHKLENPVNACWILKAFMFTLNSSKSNLPFKLARGLSLKISLFTILTVDN